MLSTSYAWYAFDNASTTFSAVTNNDDIIVSYQSGEYINTNIAVPISTEQIDKYSEKNNFNIRVKNNKIDNEIAVTVSLIDISISDALKNTNFKIDLYYQGSKVSTFGGNTIGTGGATNKTLGTVTLNNDINNNFEVRVYILDDGSDQTSMMNQTFQAKIQINAISRLKANFNDYSNSDIYISAITIDGEASDSLPTSGYYSMSATCTKGSNLTWDSISKTITYNSGSYINDDCSLTFTSSNDYPLLNEMPVGSYVKYVGNNGCVGDACKGYNANYVSDTNMGYCRSNSNKFYVNGWRIGYIEDGSAYLISAGAPECMCSNSDGTTSNSSCSSYLSSSDINKHYVNMDNIALKYCNSDYAKGGKCDTTTTWAMDATDFQKITGSTLSSSSCYAKHSNMVCGYTNDLIDNGGFYWLATNYSSSSPRSFYWHPAYRYVNHYTSNFVYGARPVLYLESSIIVVGGSGTYEDPYIIDKSAI